jgi:GxxExxY protein
LLTKVPSRLPPEQEATVYDAIGCAIRVHKALGPGFREGIYHDAMRVELSRSNIPWRSDLVVDVFYRGQPLRKQKLDLVVNDLIVLELKTVDRFHPIHSQQILSYMKAAGLPIGLLINFETTWLKGSIKRFVL